MVQKFPGTSRDPLYAPHAGRAQADTDTLRILRLPPENQAARQDVMQALAFLREGDHEKPHK